MRKSVLPQNDTTLRDATDEKFKVGDVWEYETRKGEEKSTVTILKVENSPEPGAIVHIAVDKVKAGQLPRWPIAVFRSAYAFCSASARRKCDEESRDWATV